MTLRRWETTVIFMGRGPPVLPPHLRSLDPSTLIYLEGWSILPVDCWAYRTAFASESSRCCDLEREIFGSRVSTVRYHPPCRFGLAPRWGCNLPPSVSGSGPASVDFSNATKLRKVDFLPGTPTVAWIVVALQTITSKKSRSPADLPHPLQINFER